MLDSHVLQFQYVLVGQKLQELYFAEGGDRELDGEENDLSDKGARPDVLYRSVILFKNVRRPFRGA